MDESNVVQLPGMETEEPKPESPLDRKDELGKTGRDYFAVSAAFNEPVRKFTAHWLRECLDSVLLRFDDPKGYAELHATVKHVVDGTILYLVSEGYLEPTAKALDTDEAVAKRIAEWEDENRKAEERRAQQTALFGSGAAPSSHPLAGGYI
jgi:hypothetical protein